MEATNYQLHPQGNQNIFLLQRRISETVFNKMLIWSQRKEKAQLKPPTDLLRHKKETTIVR